jgi:hypothetical protein
MHQVVDCQVILNFTAWEKSYFVNYIAKCFVKKVAAYFLLKAETRLKFVVIINKESFLI